MIVGCLLVILSLKIGVDGNELFYEPGTLYSEIALWWIIFLPFEEENCIWKSFSFKAKKATNSNDGWEKLYSMKTVETIFVILSFLLQAALTFAAIYNVG